MARAPRSDAALNRERVLDAAVVAVHRQGEKVPIAVIAADAGVGVGTVYRHFPTRADLLGALGHRSFGLVLANARDAAAVPGVAADGLRRFLERTVACRDELILPLHGAPVPIDAESEELRVRIREVLREILHRGRADGTVAAGLTADDVIMTAAMLSSPRPQVADWDGVARRQIEVYLAGIAAVTALDPAR